MANLLIYLTLPEAVRGKYGQALAPLFPELTIQTIGNEDALGDHLGNADIIVSFAAMMNEDIMAAAKNLKWIHSLGTGLDNIIDSAHLANDALVTSTRGLHGAAMSEMAFMLMLTFARGFGRMMANQAQGIWERFPAKLLENKTVGILGVGLIAEDLAPKCKAFGMKVVGISQTARAVAGIDRFNKRDELAKIAPELDFLIALVPYSKATHHIINGEILAAMKPSAYLINIARGGIVDERALIHAVENDAIAGAALDAFVEEPLPADSPLWRTKNIIITPHLGGFNDTYVEKALPQLETNLRHFLAGEPDRMINRAAR